jgi:hypothetical protein
MRMLSWLSAWMGGVLTAVITAVLIAVVTGLLNISSPRRDDTVADRPGPTGSASESHAAEVPFTVVAEVSQSDCTSPRFVPKPPEEIDFGQPLRNPPGYEFDGVAGRGWDSYPAADGSNPVSPAAVYLTVQGKTPFAVVITSLEVVVTGRSPAPTGTVLRNGCGGEISYRWLVVDLDDDPPRVRSEVDEVIIELLPPESPAEREPIRFPYQVSSTDPEVFEIVTNTVDCDCSWVAVVSWQSGGRSGRTVVDNDGRDFRTIGSAHAVAVCDAVGEECMPL